jgi:hypothetical protein
VRGDLEQRDRGRSPHVLGEVLEQSVRIVLEAGLARPFLEVDDDRVGDVSDLRAGVAYPVPEVPVAGS